MDAWVTTALSDAEAKKAIILACSLRKVRTAKKIIVFITPGGIVSQELRLKLDSVFDHVSVLEPCKNNSPLNTTEEWAKLSSLTLNFARRCVYISPNGLVLKNCDEIFESKAEFAACYPSIKNSSLGGKEWDTTVWLLTPCSKRKWEFESSNEGKRLNAQAFLNWLEAQGGHVAPLEEKYNTRLNLNGGNDVDLAADICIGYFGSSHPISAGQGHGGKFLLGNYPDLGLLEKNAVKICLDIFQEHFTEKHEVIAAPLGKYETEPIAVVGLSFRLPKANDVNELWELLVQGQEGIRPVPADRWLKQHSCYPCTNRNMEAGFLSVPIDQFDAKFFGISPKDAEYLDPQQRLLHEISWEALENAMIDPLSLHGTQTGIFIGSWLYDYQSVVATKTDIDFLRCYMGNSLASTASRLSHFYGTTGPSIGTESGCSAGIVAVDMAIKSLRNKTSNLALAGGVNLILHPFDETKLSVVISPDGRCKTFDAKANGFGRAEGCAVLVLKRLSDAVRDQDHIWGLLRGSAMQQEGTSMSLGTPTVHSESLAMELALEDAGVSPLEVSYIETHGTGTPVGDPLEIAAITKAYSKGRTEPVLIGSVKTNIGHTESVSGITGIIKVLLSMKYEMIPKHLNLETLNPAINLSLIPAEIPLENVPWPKNSNSMRIAGVSSFGISGTDAHVILEEAPEVEAFDNQVALNNSEDRPLHILKVSAKTPESLQELLLKYETLFSEDTSSFADICYSANTRSNFNQRAVIIAQDSKEALKILQEKTYKEANVQSSGSKLCFLFTGQGSQFPKMASSLYETSPIFQHYFDKCSKLLQNLYGISLEDVLWKNSGDLSRTLYSQTSIFVVEYCLLKLWESYGVKPDYVLGHSLGEFAAAVCAGALKFQDALKLVAERSLLIDNLPPGKMLVIRADKKTVDELLHSFGQNNRDFWLDYAAVNAPDQTVLAGDSRMIEDFEKFCLSRSLKTVVLQATHAFHSRHMEPILEEYRKIASQIIHPASVENAPQYISGMEGRLIPLENLDSEYWVRHTREKVSFMEACKAIQSEGCNLFLEIGPHPVLSALTMMNSSEPVTCLPSIRRTEQEWSTLLETLGKLYFSEWSGQINWRNLDKFYKRERVSIPFYQFQRKPVWTSFERVRADLHPLLGKLIPMASSQTVFESKLTLKKAPFVEDHVIGNTIIFPGAGYLEMCLVGGVAASQGLTEQLIKPRRPVALKDLIISAPFAMYDSTVTHLQTTVSLEPLEESQNNGGNSTGETEQMGYDVTIHRSVDPEEDGPSVEHSSWSWMKHTTAKYMPLSTHIPSEIPEVERTVHPKKLQESWVNQGEDSVKRFYSTVLSAGLRFGPKFHSIQELWTNEEASAVLTKISLPEDHRQYLIHPLAADAMFQTLMLSTAVKKETENENDKSTQNKLRVPFHIGQFIWLKESSSVDSTSDSSTNCNQYIYCGKNASEEVYCILLDEDGTALAYMSKIELLSTTAKLIEGKVHQMQYSQGLTKYWKEVWKSCPGPLQNSIPGDQSIKRDYSDEDSVTRLKAANEIGGKEMEAYNGIVKLTRLYFLQALYKLGWKPEAGRGFTVEELISSLGIHECHRRYLRFFLRQLESPFNLQKLIYKTEDGGELYKFGLNPPTPGEVEDELEKIRKEMDFERKDFPLIVNIGRGLPKVLQKDMEALQILFPENPKEPSAGAFYETLVPWANKVIDVVIHPTLEGMYQAGMAKFRENAAKLPVGSVPQAPTLRVLEIGAGTGAFTKKFLEFFEVKVERYKYHYTDISLAFFISAEKTLKDHLNSVVFQKFDMEKDPLEQGFHPGYFDLILAAEVVHISEYMNTTLRNIRTLLKPGGMLIFFETIIPDPRLIFGFGLLEGYWRCKDREYATLTREHWTKALEETDFENIEITPYYNDIHGTIAAFAPIREYTNDNTPLRDLYPKKNTWLIFTAAEIGEEFTLGILEKFHGVNRATVTVSKKEVNHSSEEDTKTLIKAKLEECIENGRGRLEGILYLWGLSTEEDPDLDRDQSRVSLPFMSLCQAVASMGIKSHPPKIYCVTQGLGNIDPIDTSNPSPGTMSGILRSITNEDISLKVLHLDLPPGESPVGNLHELFMNLWGVGNEVVYAFRNGSRVTPKLVSATFENNEPLTLPSGCERYQLVLPPTRLISDLEFSYLPPYILEDNEVEVKVHSMALNFRDILTILKPIKDFVDFNSVGLEFAGTVVRIGSQVTKRTVGERVIGLNFEKNLSLPSHMKLEENMLVPLPPHVTNMEGATLPAVFSTAAYCLLHVAQMKKGDTILIHTASGGVGLCAIQLAQYVGADIIATAGSPRKRRYLRNLGIKHIFNSRSTLFGEQILEVTGGKGVTIVLNSLTGEGFKEASLSALGQNGRFVEMSKLNIWSEEEVSELRPDVFYRIVDVTKLEKEDMRKLHHDLERFMEENIIQPIAHESFDALNIRGALNYMQKAKHIGKIICNMPEVNTSNSRWNVYTPLLNERSTYIVTGGLGGIGYAVVKRMLEIGAKHICILSRSHPTPEIQAEIDSWNKAGKHVEAFSVDVGDWSQLQELFSKISSESSGFPKVRGVMHAAGVLQDALLSNQTWEKFKKTYNAKVNGTWNLHLLTKDVQLEHFVLFSSLAAQFGSPGQSNHCASNSFLDAFACYRRSCGLPCTSINWGHWGEVGVATEIDLPGILPISTSQGLLALETTLRTQSPHLTVLNVESFKMAMNYFPSLKHYVEDSRLLNDIKGAVIVNSVDFWKEVDSAQTLEDKENVFKKYIKIIVRGILKMGPDEVIEDNADFRSYGIDSLMILEMKNAMQNIFGSRLTLSTEQLKDCSNTQQLAQRLVDILVETEGGANVKDHWKRLVKQDCNIIPEIELKAEMEEGTKKVSEIRRVLLTGATGNLGPWILRDLVRRSQISRIYCLVRPGENISAGERLQSRLEELGILQEVQDLGKVECLEGDLTSDKLGLSEEQYETLAEDVDAVIHLASSTLGFDGEYSSSTDPLDKTGIRSVNVLGTVKVLEFTGRKMKKHLLFSSAIRSVVQVDQDGNLEETWQNPGAYDNIQTNLGYEASKHVAEQIIRNSMEKYELPCKIFRYPYIGGNSETGRVNLDNNEVLQRWLTFMRLGYMLDLPTPVGLIAVDRCSKVTLEAFLDSNVPSGVYHVMQKDIEVDQEIITIAKDFGVNIESIPYQDFRTKLEELVKQDSNPYFQTVLDRLDKGFSAYLDFSSVDTIKTYYEKGARMLNKLKLSEMIQGFDSSLENMRDVVKRDLTYLKDNGVFQQFGIESS